MVNGLLKQNDQDALSGTGDVLKNVNNNYLFVLASDKFSVKAWITRQLSRIGLDES